MLLKSKNIVKNIGVCMAKSSKNCESQKKKMLRMLKNSLLKKKKNGKMFKNNVSKQCCKFEK